MTQSNNSAQQPMGINYCKYCGALIHPSCEFCDEGCRAKWEKQHQPAAQQPVKTAEEIFIGHFGISMDSWSYKQDVLNVMQKYANQFREGQQGAYREALEKIAFSNFAGTWNNSFYAIRNIARKALSSPALPTETRKNI
jgi:hypothetical protein